MLRHNLTCLLVSLSVLTFGQTYFYASAITIDPVIPTVNDNITVNVFGDLSNPSSYVQNKSFAVNGFEIDVVMDCATGIGIGVLVPHTESLPIGMLPAGNYHINISGTALGDFIIDTTDYYFTVSGATGVAESFQPASPSYKLFVDADSGLIQVTQKGDAGMDLIQILDMKGQVIMEESLNGERIVQLQLPSTAQGIFFVTVQSGNAKWSDIFAIPK